MYPKYLDQLAELTYDMWKAGWDEYNGGNVSYILSEDEVSSLVEDYKDTDYVIHEKPYSQRDILDIPENMQGSYLLITATWSHFRELKDRIPIDTGIIKLIDTGYDVVAGFNTGKKPTSEIFMHVLAHSSRREQNPDHRVVVHNHATNVVLYSLLKDVTSRSLTLDLWRVLTESIVVFPDGIEVLPWEVPGTLSIGKKTAEKLQKCRLVVWAKHGVLATGVDFQDCFGLIETANKAAGLAVDVLNISKGDLEGMNILTDDDLRKICKALNVSGRYL